MEEVGRRNLWLNAQQEQAMDVQYSQMQGPARSGESLHPSDGRGAVKSPMALFAQTPSPPAPNGARPYPQSSHTVSFSQQTRSTQAGLLCSVRPEILATCCKPARSCSLKSFLWQHPIKHAMKAFFQLPSRPSLKIT